MASRPRTNKKPKKQSDKQRLDDMERLLKNHDGAIARLQGFHKNQEVPRSGEPRRAADPSVRRDPPSNPRGPPVPGDTLRPTIRPVQPPPVSPRDKIPKPDAQRPPKPSSTRGGMSSEDTGPKRLRYSIKFSISSIYRNFRPERYIERVERAMKNELRKYRAEVESTSQTNNEASIVYTIDAPRGPTPLSNRKIPAPVLASAGVASASWHTVQGVKAPDFMEIRAKIEQTIATVVIEPHALACISMGLLTMDNVYTAVLPTATTPVNDVTVSVEVV